LLAFKKEFQKIGGSFVALAKSFEFDERPGGCHETVVGIHLKKFTPF